MRLLRGLHLVEANSRRDGHVVALETARVEAVEAQTAAEAEYERAAAEAAAAEEAAHHQDEEAVRSGSSETPEAKEAREGATC